MEIHCNILLVLLIPILLSFFGLLACIKKLKKEQKEFISAQIAFEQVCFKALSDNKIDNKEITEIIEKGKKMSKEGKEAITAYEELTNKIKELITRIKK